MELKHSRTKGSKNGIRLYQNKDGTWTELGKERRRKGDERKQKRKEARDAKDTKNAIKTLTREAKENKRMADDYAAEATTLRRSKTGLFKRPSIDDLKTISEIEKKGQEYLNKSTIASKRIDDINAGTLKVGEDFIVNTKWHFDNRSILPYRTTRVSFYNENKTK